MSDLERQYNESQKAEKEKIKNSKHKLWAWVRYIFIFPFKWCYYNLRDWRTFIIFLIVFVVVSCEVWVPYLLGLIIPSIRAVMWSVGSACWLFWLGPGTPFMVICISITIFIKSLYNKIKGGKNKNENSIKCK